MAIEKYLDFCLMPRGDSAKKTDTWEVRNKRTNDLLGEVRWYAPWRKYCFYVHQRSVFDDKCMQEIASFMTRQMAKRRAQKQTKNK